MTKYNNLLLQIVISLAVIVGSVYFLNIYMDSMHKEAQQWCIDHAQECARRKILAQKNSEIEENAKLQEKGKFSCGISYDKGWGGWRCKIN